MYTTISSNKVRLDDRSVGLVLNGLAAGERENRRLAEDARRLGYPAQAAGFAALADEYAALLAAADSVGVERITVRHS